jgi:polysaccharide pyruvyl transferase WcaK-like protein
MKKILLVGYYGFKNLGDDILFITTYNLIKSVLKDAQIHVLSESRHPGYLLNLTDGNFKWTQTDENEHFDLIVHGGGGVFFDFQSAGAKYYLFNKIIRAIGFDNFKALFSLYKSLKKKKGLTADKRIGIGIGVGTFTPSSRKFYSKIQVLADYDYLFVRDEQSLNNIKKFNFNYPIKVTSDLAFLKEFWMPPVEASISPDGNRIGLILRDWIYDNNEHFKAIEATCLELEHKGYKVTCYALDQVDSQFISYFSRKFNMVCWNPDEISLESFIGELCQENLVISSRAHGALVAACLNIPSICVGIEPKLATIARMLNNSSTFLEVSAIGSCLKLQVEQYFNNLPAYQDAVKQDFAFNHHLNNQFIEELKPVLQLN